MRQPSRTAGPGAFFVAHPAAYRMSLVGAARAAVAFGAKAKRSRSRWPRLGWGTLAAFEALQLAGIWQARGRARGAGSRSGPRAEVR
jgi:hypothetical protein